jgi:hypothetical protein
MIKSIGIYKSENRTEPTTVELFLFKIERGIYEKRTSL